MNDELRRDLDMFEAFLGLCRAELASVREMTKSVPLNQEQIERLKKGMSKAMQAMLKGYAMLDLQEGGFTVSVEAHDGRRVLHAFLKKGRSDWGTRERA